MPKSKGNKRSANRAVGRDNAMQSRTFTFRTREVPLRITQATSGTGGLTTVTSGGSYSNANSVSIDPYNIGGRLASVASNFTKYRIVRLNIRYIPDATSSGVTDLVAGPSTTPTYTSRSFAMGINRDPALSTLSYSQLIEMGAVYGNTSRPMKLNFVNNDRFWYFVSTTAASPTTIDLRNTAPLQLRFSYSGTSTTAIGSYGHLVFDFVVAFQGSICPNGALGATISQIHFPLPEHSGLPITDEPSDDEKKTEKVGGPVVNAAPAARNWLGL